MNQKKVLFLVVCTLLCTALITGSILFVVSLMPVNSPEFDKVEYERTHIFLPEIYEQQRREYEASHLIIPEQMEAVVHGSVQ